MMRLGLRPQLSVIVLASACFCVTHAAARDLCKERARELVKRESVHVDLRELHRIAEERAVKDGVLREIEKKFKAREAALRDAELHNTAERERLAAMEKVIGTKQAELARQQEGLQREKQLQDSKREAPPVMRDDVASRSQPQKTTLYKLAENFATSVVTTPQTATVFAGPLALVGAESEVQMEFQYRQMYADLARKYYKENGEEIDEMAKSMKPTPYRHPSPKQFENAAWNCVASQVGKIVKYDHIPWPLSLFSGERPPVNRTVTLADVFERMNPTRQTLFNNVFPGFREE